MKLNPDCIRDVLLYLEDYLQYTDNQMSMEHKEISISNLVKNIIETYDYTKEDTQYSIEKLFEVGFIGIKNISHDNNGYIVSGYISDISWNGHNFLNNIRPKSVWNATKEGASKLGLMSIHALSTISMKIVEAVVTNPTIINGIIQQI